MQSFEKYQKLFLTNVSKKIETWQERPFVEEKEIYKFLHSVKGTAASIQLPELSTEAEKVMDHVSPASTASWQEGSWSELLQPIFLHAAFNKELDLSWKVQELPVFQKEEKQPTILILENNLDFLHHFRNNMESHGYNILIAATEERALNLFYDETPDLVVIDFYLENKNGLEILEEISTQATSILTPVIIISEDGSPELAKKVYETSALDFIPKPIDFEVFTTLIRNRLLHVRSLKKQITTDKLTKAYNRTYLQDLLARKKRTFHRNEQTFCLAILDLDDFKNVNDSYGHTVGDEVLVQLSEVLHACTRPEDSVIRYGGEEFIVVMPVISRIQAKSRLGSMLEEFKSIVHTYKNHDFSLSFTAGLTEMNESVSEMEDLIVQADLALYRGKRSGKGTVTIYEPNRDIPNVSNAEKLVHISVVDDDSIIREILSDRLQTMNYFDHSVQVQAYKDGESFLKDDHDGKYKHVVLLDGVLPGMDGLEVLSQIRSHDQETVVIMLTGRQKGKDIIKALNIGADDYMTKPFSTDELVARIRRLIQRHKGGKR
ncbi:response regulator [Halobacillus halophilus]|uniref:Diguanylate cyclase domain protein / two-component response regulator n=1 Tax=Halobacillus halophilus (strain ATCC 35676 / DSM 2266 / JCM 20832 / KCTC 3685 / LMG 17431 / NBRC 102448 / NCIMB 2269) TaxID=866895 RepID=I0JQH0_HALH3|nr:response regulator [Halobacillus halophilus]ASF40405.1 response regulator [Halobacillus halophilus]CCG46390.1 diguanylate cyclase domain protein / two-component response regulator [Halobacillus halophilus DSM 2266]